MEEKKKKSKKTEEENPRRKRKDSFLMKRDFDDKSINQDKIDFWRLRSPEDRKISQTPSDMDQAAEFQHYQKEILLPRNEPHIDISVQAGEDDRLFGAWTPAFRKDSSIIQDEQISIFKQKEETKRGLSQIFAEKKKKEVLLKPPEDQPKTKRGNQVRFRKVYDPHKFYPTMPINSHLLLQPFLMSKNYVDALRRSSQMMKNRQTKSELAIRKLRKRVGRQAQMNNPSNFEYLKCRKLAKKLKRAWNLNQQIPQNVFKRVRLVRKGQINSEEDSVLESLVHKKLYLRGEPIFNRKKDKKILFSLAQKVQNIDQENKPNISNTLSTKTPNMILTSPSQQLGESNLQQEMTRNLRMTTQLKKRREVERRLRKEQKQIKTFLSFGGNLSQVEMEFEKVEYLDYANKNIRKDSKKRNSSASSKE